MMLAAFGTPLLAGQTGSAFQISVTILPAGAGTGCTTTVGPDGATVVSCRPPVISANAGTASTAGGQPIIGYRTQDSRVKVAEDVTEEAESYFAWGEFSSQMLLAGGHEYVEMRVTW